MNLMKVYIILFLSSYILGGSQLLASSCESKFFSLSIESTQTHKIRLKDVLNDLAASCKITILTADKLTNKKLNENIDSIYADDFTLDELFQLLLNEHNLFYTYDDTLSRLKISYLKTKTFNIDYINVSQMQTLSTWDITVGASGDQTQNNTTQQSTTDTSGSSQSGSNSDFTSTKTISDFTFWGELKEQIDGMLQRDGDINKVQSKSMINKDAGLIVVSGSFRQLKRVEEYINRLQTRMHKQVLLEVRILEVTYNEGQQLGVDWSNFNLSLSGSAGADINVLRASGTRNTNTSSDAANSMYSADFQFNMDGLMNFLKQYGDVEVLSSPKVMTLNNQPALINVGDQVNYKYETGTVSSIGSTTPSASTTFSLGSVFVGLSLNIIPEITDSGHIILRINPVDSRITDTVAADVVRSIPPDMKIKQLTSIVKVKDGSKVIVGGLVQKEKYDTDSKVPLLGDIPYFGRMFHSTSVKYLKKEFFVIIIPTIIKEDTMPTIEEQKVIDKIEKFQFDQNLSLEGGF